MKTGSDLCVLVSFKLSLVIFIEQIMHYFVLLGEMILSCSSDEREVI